MAIIIRPVRGQITQRALPQEPSMLRLAKAARIPTEGIMDTVDSISKTVINHQNKIEEQRVYNKNAKQEGLLRDELVIYNQKLKEQHADGDISDDQIITLYEEKHNKLYNNLKNNVYKNDEKAFKRFEGSFYVQLSQAREKALILRNNAIIGNANLSFETKYNTSKQDRQQVEGYKNRFTKDFYETEKIKYQEGLRILGRSGKINYENKMQIFEKEYLDDAIHTLIPETEGRNAQYHRDIYSKLNIAKGKPGHVAEIGGKIISKTERSEIKAETTRKIKELEYIEKTGDIEKNNKTFTTLIKKIKESNGKIEFSDIEGQFETTPLGRETENAVIDYLDNYKKGLIPTDLMTQSSEELDRRIYGTGQDAINSPIEPFYLQGEEESNKPKLSLIQREGKNFGSDDGDRYRAHLISKNSAKTKEDTQAFNDFFGDYHRLIKGKLEAYNMFSDSNLGNAIRYYRKKYEKLLKEGKTKEQLFEKGPDYILNDLDGRFIKTMNQQSRQISAGLVAGRNGIEQLREELGVINTPGANKILFNMPPNEQEWKNAQIKKDPDFLNLSPQEQINAYQNSEEMQTFLKYAPGIRTYLKNLYKKWTPESGISWEDLTDQIPKNNPVYKDFMQKIRLEKYSKAKKTIKDFEKKSIKEQNTILDNMK